MAKPKLKLNLCVYVQVYWIIYRIFVYRLGPGDCVACLASCLSNENEEQVVLRSYGDSYAYQKRISMSRARR